MKRYILLLLFILTGGLASLQAQDPVFTQFFASPAQINPAFTGNTFAPRVSMNYRNQWPTLNAYVTYSATYEQLIESLNSGFGVMLMADDQGDGLIKTNIFKALYSYRVQMQDNFFVKFGVNAGFNQAGYDWDSFVFLDQIDQISGPVDPSGNLNPTAEMRPDNTTVTYLDLGAGLLVYSPGFYAGFSIGHLNRPEDGLLRTNDNLTDGLPLFYSAQVGGEITLREGNNRQAAAFISPNVLFVKQADFGQINIGAYAGVGSFFFGSWYRQGFANPDAVILLGGFRKGIFKIGYSYDITISELAVQSPGGAHEISLILNFENSQTFQRRRRSDRYNDCFQLFR